MFFIFVILKKSHSVLSKYSFKTEMFLFHWKIQKILYEQKLLCFAQVNFILSCKNAKSKETHESGRGKTSPRICTMRLKAQLNIKEELAEA